MTSTLIHHIGELVTNDPARDGLLGIVEDAALVIEGSTIAWVGASADAPQADEAYDAGGRAVLPGFVDSHSHLVFAGDRAGEFAARMAGEPYAAGGIRTTVAATREATDEQLTSHVARLVQEMNRQGTTTLEIKSGYGLTTRDEARSLAIARQFTDETTFLGAHVVPDGTEPAAYVDLVTGPMLEAARPARAVDRRVLRAGGVRRRPGARGPRGGSGGRAAGAGCTPTSWAPGRASGWPPSSACSPSTTAPTSTTRTSTPCATPAPSPRCCPASSSRPGSPTPMPVGCSTPASGSRSRATATPAAASPARSRCASRSRSGRWG